MTPQDLRLVALAAVLARERAAALLERVAPPLGAGLSAEAARLSAAPRRERLGALAEALAHEPGSLAAAAEAAAEAERPPVAALLRAVAAGAAEAARAAPALVRLCRERIEG